MIDRKIERASTIAGSYECHCHDDYEHGETTGWEGVHPNLQPFVLFALPSDQLQRAAPPSNRWNNET